MARIEFKADGKTPVSYSAYIGQCPGFCAKTYVNDFHCHREIDDYKRWGESEQDYKERIKNWGKDFPSMTLEEAALCFAKDLIADAYGSYIVFADEARKYRSKFDETMLNRVCDLLPTKFDAKDADGKPVTVTFYSDTGAYKNRNTGNMVREVTYRLSDKRKKSKRKGS